MDGNATMKLRASLAAVVLAALGGSISPSFAGELAGEAAAHAAAAPSDTAELPRFVPTAEAESETAFVQIDEPAADTLEAGALDMTGIEPATEPPARELGAGMASWYGRQFAGRKTANGERFDPGQYTAAHRTLPFGSKVRVTHGGKSVVVRINDRGPFQGGRVIDLSQAAAAELGIVRAGVGRVELALVGD